MYKNLTFYHLTVYIRQDLTPREAERLLKTINCIERLKRTYFKTRQLRRIALGNSDTPGPSFLTQSLKRLEELTLIKTINPEAGQSCYYLKSLKELKKYREQILEKYREASLHAYKEILTVLDYIYSVNRKGERISSQAICQQENIENWHRIPPILKDLEKRGMLTTVSKNFQGKVYELANENGLKSVYDEITWEMNQWL